MRKTPGRYGTIRIEANIGTPDVPAFRGLGGEKGFNLEIYWAFPNPISVR